MKRTPTALRMRRLALGLRIRDIANKTGISDSRISEIERGEGRCADPFELEFIEGAIGPAEQAAQPRLVSQTRKVGVA